MPGLFLRNISIPTDVCMCVVCLCVCGGVCVQGIDVSVSSHFKWSLFIRCKLLLIVSEQLFLC